MIKKYCDFCEQEQSVIEKQITESFNVKGEQITATITIQVCSECGNEVWNEELEKANEVIVFSAYRKKMGLLQPSEIKAIREKYNLSQASFSKLLGFGEKTITRYENGSIQDVAHDNLIRTMESTSAFKKIWSLRKELLSANDNKKINEVLENNSGVYIMQPRINTKEYNISTSSNTHKRGGIKYA